MPRPKKLDGDAFQFYLDERAFYYLKLKEGEEFSTDHLKEIVDFVQGEHESQKLPFLIELGFGATVSEGVQEHLANGKERYSIADAILISTFAHRLITKFYKRHFKPTRPTKVFQDVFEALDWIAHQNRDLALSKG
ncbi:MAG TPA: hypothetical protein VJ911_05025 [Cryomorphaceae bacterium]|nr:hypothetical protein [Cryomorphaceae bacterium]